MLLKRNHLFGTTILAGLIAASVPAWGQTAPQPAPAASQAQNQDEQNEENASEVEEVVVTGSRIPRPQYDGVIPGVQIDEKSIEERLFTNAGDILNDVPLVGGGASLSGTNGNQTASLGVTYIDLLNLGTARTLTLVNGRRFVSNNSATIFVAGNESGSQVDASTIPVALIDRVDVLTVGGAAAYGADAVSGVVNYILKDDFEGAEITVLGGQTFADQDAARYAVSGVYGVNLLDNRLNMAVSGEYSFIDDLVGADREVRANNPGLINNFANGAQRNPAYVPGGTAPVFLPAASDGIMPSLFRPNLRVNSLSKGGLIFNVTQGNGLSENPTIANLPTGSAYTTGAAGTVTSAYFQPGNTFRNPGFAQVAPFQWSGANAFVTQQLVPAAPFGACITTATEVCAFAPASASAAQVAAARTQYGLPAGYTTAQVLAVIQARRPTAREFFAANPSVNVNDFIGTFVAGTPDIANTDAFAALLPRRAVPIRFDSNGNVVGYNLAGALATDPTEPGTSQTQVGSDGQNRQDTQVLRVKQERYVGNFLGNYQINENLRYYTENLYSDVTVTNPISNGGLANSAASTTPENAGLIVNVNHPFLTAANRQSLAAAGITGNFILSRNNEDIVNDTSQISTNKTFRTVNGFNGDFRVLNRDFTFDVSHTYGKAETHVEFSAINDVAYAMAIDAVQGASGVQCRAKGMTPAAYTASYGGSIPGSIVQPISTIGADGIRTQSLFTPTVTQAMVDACEPLNVFGEGRASQAAKDFASVRAYFNNVSTQNFTQATLTGTLFELPAGPLQFAITGELRKEELSYTTDEIGGTGRTRSAPSATTNAEVETREGGFELRIPIFGGDFSFPFLKSMELSPSIRYTKEKGEAERYRNLSGVVVSPTYDGDVEEIYTLAGTWELNDQFLLRGNISKSVRNPSIVELFLGNQAFFTSVAAANDPCTASNYVASTTRKANCIAEVQRVAAANGNTLIGSNGVARTVTDAATAEAFLTSTGGYTATGTNFTGVIAGRQTLVPEKGDSFTFGFVARPSVIPNLIVAADYLEITVTDALGPLLATDAAFYCYDSASYPNNTPDIGVNSCAGIVRDNTFNFSNGFELPYFNLGGTRVKAINANMSYSLPIGDVMATQRDLGNFGFRANVYYLLEYTTSGIGDFSDSLAADDTQANPTWKTQLSFLYDIGKFSARWTTNYQDDAIIRGANVNTRQSLEVANVIGYDAYATHNLTLGYDITDHATARLAIDNITDVQELNTNGLQNGLYVDTIGRRWTASLTYKF